MKKFIRSHIFFLVGLILTLSLLWPLMAAPFFTHHDDVQVIRLYEMDKCIKDGQIPCRWVPDLGGLYGYPIFNYYAPIPYYFGEIFYLLSHNLIFSVKVMFAVSFLGSFIFMYLLGRKFWGEMGGSLSAIFYAFAPYHAVDFYVRGAMGELWGLMLFPAIFWALTRLAERTNIRNLLLSGLFIAILISSHNLSAMIFLPLCAVFFILLFFKKRNKKVLWFSLGGIILGLLLSAFYLLPALLEKNLAHIETTTYGYFGYTEHFKGLKKLFIDRTWGWGASIREVPGGEKDGLSYQIGWVHLIGWLLALYSIKYFYKKNKWVSLLIIVSSSVTIFSIFMINPRSEFVWKMIEPLKYLQFPWRFLEIIIFFISFIAGSFFITLNDQKRRKMIWITLIVLVVALNFSYFRPEKFINTSDSQLLSGANWDKQIKRSIFDYLPIYAKEPPRDLATSRYQILTGDSKISDYKEGTNWIKFKSDTKTHTIIRLSQYYFPDWKITVDGKQINIDYNNTLGLMTFILGKGQHQIEGRLYDTQVRTISNFITAVSLILTLVLFLIQFQGIRKWILYYRKRID